MRLRLLCLVAAVAPAFGGPINLGSAGSFALLGGTITETGGANIVGNVGATTTITVNDPWTVSGTVFPAGSATAVTAYNDFVNAFNTGMGLAPTQQCAGGNQLTGNCTFTGNNVYTFSNSDISTTTGINLTFDANNDANEYFVIRIAQSLTVNGVLAFTLQNQARADHIFWIVGTDATISVGSSPAINFQGNILAGSSFTMSAQSGGSGVLAGTINGCVFAQTANTLAGQTNINGCSDYNTVFGPGRTAIPEPGSLGLASLGGLLGVFLWRKPVWRKPAGRRRSRS